MATITVSIPDTTFVSSALPDTNLFFCPLIYTGTDPSFQNCISFLQIDLSALPVTSVDSAMLELAVIVQSGAASSPIAVDRVIEPFSVDAVTYATSPAYTATSSTISIPPADVYQVIRIDITELVNGWLNGTYANNGLALTNTDNTSTVIFATDKCDYEPFFPKLMLTYPPATPQTAFCFSYAQLANLIEQLITLYPTNTISVFLTGFSPSAITGTPYMLYSSPEATYGALFILMDNGQEEAIPLNAITAIYTGDGSVYDPSITYLTPPEFPDTCDKNLITAYHDYLPVSTQVQMYLGSLVQASGLVYKNEYGLIVLSDAEGNTPVFIPILNATAILPASPLDSEKTPSLPRISLTNSNQN